VHPKPGSNVCRKDVLAHGGLAFQHSEPVRFALTKGGAWQHEVRLALRPSDLEESPASWTHAPCDHLAVNWGWGGRSERGEEGERVGEGRSRCIVRGWVDSI
jgi:hypothetical protein